MNHFAFFKKTLFAISVIFLLLTSGTFAGGPLKSTPKYLGQKSRADLDKIKTQMRVKNLGPRDQERAFENLVILAQNNPRIPLQYDPHHETPIDFARNLDNNTRMQITEFIDREVQARPVDCNCEEELVFWGNFRELVFRGDRQVQVGRGFGDPHIDTYDGLNYPLQRVGEFVLTRSKFNDFEIQTRQSQQGQYMSLNTAVAMNVRGDRVCVYSRYRESPDWNQETPLRINGRAFPTEGPDIKLPNGGILKFNRNRILVFWPTGERASIQVIDQGPESYLNLAPMAFRTGMGTYEGLMGNANGDWRDDLTPQEGSPFPPSGGFYGVEDLLTPQGVRTGTRNIERQYLELLAKDFGDTWRVTDATTLFDYEPGKTTAHFTDWYFPPAHIILADAEADEADSARIKCEEAGVSEEDMQACMLDVIYSGDDSFAGETADMSDTDEIVSVLEIKNPVVRRPFVPVKEKEVRDKNKELGKQLKPLAKPRKPPRTIFKPADTGRKKEVGKKPKPIPKPVKPAPSPAVTQPAESAPERTPIIAPQPSAPSAPESVAPKTPPVAPVVKPVSKPESTTPKKEKKTPALKPASPDKPGISKLPAAQPKMKQKGMK